MGQDLQDFAIAAELRGATMSGLVHMFVRQTIRAERERSPEAFSLPEAADEDPTPGIPVVSVDLQGVNNASSKKQKIG